jgi:hypothetical protein
MRDQKVVEGDVSVARSRGCYVLLLGWVLIEMDVIFRIAQALSV